MTLKIDTGAAPRSRLHRQSPFILINSRLYTEISFKGAECLGIEFREFFVGQQKNHLIDYRVYCRTFSTNT
jgi:hypothetical protein